MYETPLGIVDFISYKESVPVLMKLLGADLVLGSQKRVVIKTNLVNTSSPPITTPVELVSAIVEYVKAVSDAEMVVAEGCGAPLYSTYRPYRKLGYLDMAKSNGVVLVDLNSAELKELADHRCRVFPRGMGRSGRTLRHLQGR